MLVLHGVQSPITIYMMCIYISPPFCVRGVCAGETYVYKSTRCECVCRLITTTISRTRVVLSAHPYGVCGARSPRSIIISLESLHELVSLVLYSVSWSPHHLAEAISASILNSRYSTILVQVNK